MDTVGSVLLDGNLGAVSLESLRQSIQCGVHRGIGGLHLPTENIKARVVGWPDEVSASPKQSIEVHRLFHELLKLGEVGGGLTQRLDGWVESRGFLGQTLRTETGG